jgi:beta-galactosidase
MVLNQIKKFLGYSIALCFITLFFSTQSNAQIAKPQTPYFGVAYYDEYMPYERLDKDIAMMKEAGINCVRIAESTWATEEPQDNVYDFSHIDRVLNAMNKAGIKVIIGTPTYAVPAWLVKKYPDILATTPQGQRQYGARQNMDITNKNFLFHAERIIRKIMEHVKDHPAIIGYQVDNETKSYSTSGENVQKAFVVYMKDKFKTLDAINAAFGLNYWSNRINSWEEFPSVNGSINASLKSEFSKFQRQLVTNYLAWQASIVKEYAKPTQFVTQNLDYDFKGYSYGIQTDVDHFAVAKSLDIAGVDIYHPTQDHLTGAEISFGGDVSRSTKGGKNYFVIETEAQGFAQWVPYENQLRLQAFSHLASGANMVEYWHWHSIHNALETYWKGLLSQDFEPNPTYNEAKTIGADFKRIGTKLIDLKKQNEVAFLFSNEALTAFNEFKFGWGTTKDYNDILRNLYDATYRLNVGTDFIDPSVNFKYGEGEYGKYKMIIVPALYAASDDVLKRLNQFVKEGGQIIYTFKSGFSDENVTVRNSIQPGIINEACGIKYSQFTVPEGVTLKGDPYNVGAANNTITDWMELITPTTAEVLATYDHPEWGKYAAVTRNKYGKGTATYIGCVTSPALTEAILKQTFQNAGLWGKDQQYSFPIITKSGINNNKKTLRYFFNYSATPKTITYSYKDGVELLKNEKVKSGNSLELKAWDVKIIEEN